MRQPFVGLVLAAIIGIVVADYFPAISHPILFIAILATARGQHDVAIFAPIDLVLVPGIAFTRAGARIGRGAGFFDRFLAHRAARAIKIGIAFSFQIVESIPLDRYDVKLDLVVSD